MKQTIKIGAFAFGLCLVSLAQAQTPTPQQAYEQAKAYCTTLSAEAQKNCQRDAYAAFNQAKKQGSSTKNTEALSKNRLARCDQLPTQQQSDCKAQMTGSYDTKVYGSVEGGGVLRQSIIEIPGQPVNPRTPVTLPAAPVTQPIR